VPGVRLLTLATLTFLALAELRRRALRMGRLELPARPRPRLGLGASSDGRSARDTDDLLTPLRRCW